MSLEHPWLLVTLLLVPAALGAYLLLARRRQRYPVRFTNLEVLGDVAPRHPVWRTHLPAALLGLALVALAIAVARPELRRLAPVERATVILVVDRSRSMEAQDVRPSRLAAAKAAAAAFLERVPRRLQVGIVTFSGDVTVVASPTSDHERLERSVATIGTRWTGYGGTAIGDALARAVELGRDAMRERGLAAVGSSPAPANVEGAVTILFLSDGRQNRGILPPAEGARLAAEAGIPVYTVALGTATGGGRPGGGGVRLRQPRAGPGDTADDRGADGRRVLPGPVEHGAERRLPGSRLARRPRAPDDRGHVRLRRRCGARARRGRAPLPVPLARAALAADRAHGRPPRPARR